MKNCFLWLLFPFALTACKSVNSLRNALLPMSPYEKYVQRLEEAGLKKSLLATSWKEAGEKVFLDSIFVTLPFVESGFFAASNPSARSYRFEAKEGQVLSVE